MSLLKRTISFIPVVLLFLYFVIDFSTYFQKVFYQNLHLYSQINSKENLPHVGQINKFKITTKNQQVQRNSSQELQFLQLVSLNKKIDKYIFTHYNWYRFQLNFIDLEYDSQFQFRLITENTGVVQFSQKVGFSLNDYFYPTQQNQSPQNQGLKISFCGNGSRFKINIKQYTVSQLSNNQHDGHIFEPLNKYSPQQVVKKQQINIFLRTKKTITTFNITYERQDIHLKLNLTHVLRHDQCLTDYNDNQNILNHRCMGGYGYGRIQMDRFQIDNTGRTQGDTNIYGNWKKDVFNVERTRTRTIFKGLRSTRNLYYKTHNYNLINIFPRTNWKWTQMNIDFNGFSKYQYYQKKDNIQKERWIGISIFNNFDRINPELSDTIQQFVFMNGKIIPIHHLEYDFYMEDHFIKNQKLVFKSTQISSVQDIKKINSTETNQAYAYLELQIFQSKINQVKQFGKCYRILSIDGFWSGSVYAQTKDQKLSINEIQRQRVDFYNITGTIQILQGIF